MPPLDNVALRKAGKASARALDTVAVVVKQEALLQRKPISAGALAIAGASSTSCPSCALLSTYNQLPNVHVYLGAASVPNHPLVAVDSS